MYSYPGPVIVAPPGFLAIGRLMYELKFAGSVPADLSQPENASVYPRGIRNEFARALGSVTAPGSLPPTPRFKVAIVLPPRLGGSYIMRCEPFDKSMGFR